LQTQLWLQASRSLAAVIPEAESAAVRTPYG